MPKCSRCKETKEPHDFNFKVRSLNILQKSCKICTRLEIRKHYDKNKDYYLEKAKKRNKINRLTIQTYIWSYLTSHPCVDCGEKDPIVLDFDHKSDKISEVSSIIKSNQSLTKIKEEISKCEVRCANCHRRKTAKDFNWYKHKFASVA